MLRELTRSAQGQAIIPDVRAERCVHTITEQASCRVCVDACPTAAWVIDDEMLGIDAARCDGCGLCAAACPEAAIVQRFRPELRETLTGRIAIACCERVPASGEGAPRMPCVHAISTADLLQLARGDVKYLITAGGDCDRCPRGQGVRLEQRLHWVNLTLSDRRLPTLAHRSIAAHRWHSIWRQAEAADRRKPISRRGFFRAAVEEPTRRVEAALTRAQGGMVPPGALLSRRTGNERALFSPIIDTGRCSGCDACVRLCPHDAICTEMEVDLPSAYVIAADQCTGCGICVDVCGSDAIRLQQSLPVTQVRLPLSNRSCRACGATYHLPRRDDPRDTDPLCPICSRTGHHSRLFQVLD